MIKPVKMPYYHVLVFTHCPSRNLQYPSFLSVWDLDSSSPNAHVNSLIISVQSQLLFKNKAIFGETFICKAFLNSK